MQNGFMDDKIKRAVMEAVRENPDEIRRAVASEELATLLADRINEKGKRNASR